MGGEHRIFARTHAYVEHPIARLHLAELRVFGGMNLSAGIDQAERRHTLAQPDRSSCAIHGPPENERNSNRNGWVAHCATASALVSRANSQSVPEARHDGDGTVADAIGELMGDCTQATR